MKKNIFLLIFLQFTALINAGSFEFHGHVQKFENDNIVHYSVIEAGNPIFSWTCIQNKETSKHECTLRRFSKSNSLKEDSSEELSEEQSAGIFQQLEKKHAEQKTRYVAVPKEEWQRIKELIDEIDVPCYQIALADGF